MLLVSAKVGPFKSIDEPTEVAIDPEVTVLVGMNEAGKTVFLQALEKSADALGVAAFNPIEDYPRKNLNPYLKQHGDDPSPVTVLTYKLADEEVEAGNTAFKTKLPKGFTFSVTRDYKNDRSIEMAIDEKPTIVALVNSSALGSDAKKAIGKATTLRSIPGLLKDVQLTDDDKVFLAGIEARIKAAGNWSSVIGFEVWTWLTPRIPRFAYFGDYQLLPGKVNLPELAQRAGTPAQLRPDQRAALALLRMADIGIADLTNPDGYETIKAKLEGISNSITDQVFKYWKQNEELEVEFDIRPDPKDEAPFNNGANLYIRIRNRRHRVTVPFNLRSRGFIWFFSFLVWFDSVKDQLALGDKKAPRQLVLLLDEPGLSLHALAQADFLAYIDSLAERQQVLYSTHSPFMVHSDRLHQVRVVEDRVNVGTTISDNVSGSDPRTVFPLQAALGYTIAQNLFISERNLLVEGAADLVYLQVLSAHLESLGRTGLRDDVTIVPTGGLDKVVTFVALLGANGLKLAVLHDYRGTPDQKLLDLVKQRMISPTAVLNASQFRDLSRIGIAGQASDLEDLLAVPLYLDYFNRGFAARLGGATVAESDLPTGDRIIERLERCLKSKGIQLRGSGGFNHFTPASHFASNPPSALDSTTLDRFEELFGAVNALF
jgi:hypothetical protein